MNAHTLGPWVATAGKSPNGYWHVDTDIGEVMEICQVWRASEDGTTTAANAHVIAAAPDLLSALRGAVQALEDNTTMDRLVAISSARAAIAKAEGK